MTKMFKLYWLLIKKKTYLIVPFFSRKCTFLKIVRLERFFYRKLYGFVRLVKENCTVSAFFLSKTVRFYVRYFSIKLWPPRTSYQSSSLYLRVDISFNDVSANCFHWINKFSRKKNKVSGNTIKARDI